MLARNLFSNQVRSLRRFSSPTPCMLKIGDTLKQTRTFMDEDVMVYAKVSHDTNPVHFDSEYAQNAGFEDRLVHGMLVASMFPRIISYHFLGAVYISQIINFKLPIYIGEEIVSEAETINLRRMKNRYIAKFKSRCFKNGKVVAIDGEGVAILPSLDVAHVNR